MRTLLTYVQFQWRHYVRSHRYLRELAAVVIFHIFFWGFLYDQKAERGIWLLLGVFAIILNVVTTPSLFYLEKGNTLHFLVGRPFGRRYFLFSKILFIVAIDSGWLGIFAILYGLRFLEWHYFVVLPLHFIPIIILLLLATLLLAFSFTIRPHFSWLLFLAIVFGGIVNKPAVLPLHGIADAYKLLVFFLPPFQELIFFSMKLHLFSVRGLFFLVALVQIALLLFLNDRAMQRRDLV